MVGLLFPLILFAAPDEIQILDKFDSVSTNSPDVYDFIDKCMPTTTETSFKKLMHDVENKPVGVLYDHNWADSYVIANKTRVMCIPMTDKRYPVLPLEVFDETVSFVTMPPAKTKTFKMSMARQIAEHGIASALIKDDNDHATAVYYMLASVAPITLYYHTDSLKLGTFNENSFPLALQIPYGSMTVIGRGKPAENVKFIGKD